MRTLTLTAAALAASMLLAFSAQAATLTMVADKSTYTASETITLTITGDSQGAAALAIFGTVSYNNALVTATGNGQTNHTSFGFLNWLAGALQVDLPNVGTADAFSQINGTTGALTVDQLQIATLEFHVNAVGGANFSWFTIGAEALSFFGLTNAGGTSVTIVPEPTTAALLGIGLFGLAVAGRRRR